MFGLIRFKSACGSEPSPWYRRHRLHYCGTCKTLARDYGQMPRLYLNFDLVFMAELLSALSAANPEENWAPAYQRINQCWDLPQAEEQPELLRYTAAANVLLAELKLQDKIQDSPWARFWQLLKRAQQGHFAKAQAFLAEKGLDVKACLERVQAQAGLEQAPQRGQDLPAELSHYALSTSLICGDILAQGAAQFCPEQQAACRQLGQILGQLVYALDALEDYPEDKRKGQFNPLRAYEDEAGQVQAQALETCRQYILHQQNAFLSALEQLPLEESLREHFAARFCGQVGQRLYRQSQPRLSTAQRRAQAWQQAKAEVGAWFCQPQALPGLALQPSLRYYILILAVFIQPNILEQRQPSLQGEGLWFWGLGLLGLALFSRLKSQALPPAAQAKRRRKGLKTWFKKRLDRLKGLKRRDCAQQLAQFSALSAATYIATSLCGVCLCGECCDCCNSCDCDFCDCSCDPEEAAPVYWTSVGVAVVLIILAILTSVFWWSAWWIYVLLTLFLVATFVLAIWAAAICTDCY